MKIISLVGLKRTGKDTTADYLIKKYGFVKYSFADPIKKACQEMFGFTEEQLWGNTKEEIDERWGVSPRKMLQIIGTELFQYDIHKHIKSEQFNNIGRDIWVHRFKIWVEMNKDKYPRVVIADCRFLHEANVVKEMGGTLWKIERPSIDNLDKHSSETGVSQIIPDITIINNSGIETLHKKIDKYFTY